MLKLKIKNNKTKDYKPMNTKSIEIDLYNEILKRITAEGQRDNKT